MNTCTPTICTRSVERQELTVSTVIVLGGGIGGLTAAHELIERGFSVRVTRTVLEAVRSGIRAAKSALAR